MTLPTRMTINGVEYIRTDRLHEMTDMTVYGLSLDKISALIEFYKHMNPYWDLLNTGKN